MHWRGKGEGKFEKEKHTWLQFEGQRWNSHFANYYKTVSITSLEPRSDCKDMKNERGWGWGAVQTVSSTANEERKDGQCASLRVLQGIPVDFTRAGKDWGSRLLTKRGRELLEKIRPRPPRRGEITLERSLGENWSSAQARPSIWEDKPFLRAKEVLMDKDEGTKEQSFEVERTGEQGKWIFSIKCVSQVPFWELGLRVWEP